MARRLSWSDVRGGLVAVVVIAIVATAILKFLRVGALHGDTFRLYALVGEARGVTPGSEVWLNGQKIGKIIDIRFLPASADTARRIQIEMEVLEAYRAAMRNDAQAQIRSGGSIVGPPVVYLSAGTHGAGPLRANDTVRTRPQADVEGATGQFATATKELPAIIANVKLLAQQLGGTDGTAGAMMNGPGLRDLGRAQSRAKLLMDRLSGSGTAGFIMRGGLTVRAHRVMARADSVRALLASSNTSLGRFRKDSTLAKQVGDIRNELTLLQANLAAGRGTAGRAVSDSALRNAVAEAQQEMTLLLADFKKHPLRYISF
jgi:phospholipid/cholesterol/gamma-HCH transport system substrate-binding protein